MAIDFKKGEKGKDGKEGEGSWLKHTLDHLKSEYLAVQIIQSAAEALRNVKEIDLILWRNAASGGPGLLRVTKGPHTHKTEGPLAGLLHITMILYDVGSKEGSVYPNTYFAIPNKKDVKKKPAFKRFHLYSEVQNPNAPVSEQRLKPIKLSYQTIMQTLDPAFDPKKDYLFKVIENATAIKNDVTSRT
jgi:hypothetical protein